MATHVVELIVECHVCIRAHGSARAGEEHEGCCGYVRGAVDGRVNGVP